MEVLKWIVVCILLLSLVEALEIQGHRGARGILPENTLPAFKAAIEAEVDTLELDLLVTSDGTLIIHHNFEINPEICTYMDGTPLLNTTLLRTLSLSEIKKIDCGCKQHPDFPKQMALKGTEIPTLEELFCLVKNLTHPHAKKVRLNLEIKVHPLDYTLTIAPALFAQKVVHLVKESGLGEQIIYTSFDPNVLKEIKQLDPQAKMGFILNAECLSHLGLPNPEHWVDFVLSAITPLHAEVISPEECLLNQEIIEKLHRAGYRVIPWVVNDKERALKLIEMGVDGLISDYPFDLLPLKNY